MKKLKGYILINSGTGNNRNLSWNYEELTEHKMIFYSSNENLELIHKILNNRHVSVTTIF